MVYNTARQNIYLTSSPEKQQQLTFSERKTLHLDQNTEVSGWIHTSHLATWKIFKYVCSNKWWSALEQLIYVEKCYAMPLQRFLPK